MPVSLKKILKTCSLLYLISQIFFLINIQFPRGHNFDEFHYVPSAKQHLELKENRNYEHPPLAKEMMAIGIGTFGDRPIGWRFMSTLFGALTLVGMYLWALSLFRSQEIALWTAALTLTNQLLYVQARIGMLDTFMFAFIVYAMAAFTASWDVALHPKNQRKLLLFAGVMLGLATACKWFAVIPWVLCIGLVLLVRIFQKWGARFKAPSADDWYQPELWSGISSRDLLLSFLILPLAAYYFTFIPALFQKEVSHSLWDIFFGMQARMWDGQSRVVDSHPYMSKWTAWAILKRPIWYAFDKEGPGGQSVRGVLLIGNPLIMWSGLGALLICLWDWIQERRRDAMLILFTFGAFYLSWALIPRKVSFYYYYYPAGMTLSLALAYLFHRHEKDEGTLRQGRWARGGFLLAATLIFGYFFPILAALKIPSSSFAHYMWFSSWI